MSSHNKAARQRGAPEQPNGNAAADQKRPPPPPKTKQAKATEVWAHNLEEAIAELRDVAETYGLVAAEVLLPKVIASPTGPFGDYSEYNYQMLRCNVDLTRALQISLTLSDGKGNRPKGTSTWRFNFNFNPQKDFFLQETLDQLSRNCGVDLGKHHSQGIAGQEFGEQLMSSGLVLSDDVKWISFVGSGGLAEKPPQGAPGRPAESPERRFCGMYGFGYLLQLLTSQEMPDAVEGFRDLLDLYFPCRCDIAEHIADLPQLSGRDPSDPQKRPYFCNAQHVLDGFFRLPEAVRNRAFDKPSEKQAKPEEPAVATGQSRRSHRRRHNRSDDKERAAKTNGSTETASASAAGSGGAAAAATTDDGCAVNGAAKTGGG